MEKLKADIVRLLDVMGWVMKTDDIYYKHAKLPEQQIVINGMRVNNTSSKSIEVCLELFGLCCVDDLDLPNQIGVTMYLSNAPKGQNDVFYIDSIDEFKKILNNML